MQVRLRNKTDKYISEDILNEILMTMAFGHVANSVHSTPIFAAMVSETNEKTLPIRSKLFFFADRSMEFWMDFVGIYINRIHKGLSAIYTLCDFMTGVNLSITRMRGQCYDGASSMAGTEQGVEAQILQETSRHHKSLQGTIKVFTQSYEQSLKPACSDIEKTLQAHLNLPPGCL